MLLNRICQNIANQEKSGESPQNQLLNSGEFLPGEKFENQETPGQIRRFVNPGSDPDLIGFRRNPTKFDRILSEFL